MSSAINHKKRSRRGYRMQRSFFAEKKTPLITYPAKKRRNLLRLIFRRIMGLAD